MVLDGPIHQTEDGRAQATESALETISLDRLRADFWGCYIRMTTSRAMVTAVSPVTVKRPLVAEHLGACCRCSSYLAEGHVEPLPFVPSGQRVLSLQVASDRLASLSSA